MKKNNLENFISEHRSEFDSENPPPMVWMNIENQLSQKNQKEETKTLIREIGKENLFRLVQVAAMFIIVMGVGLIIGMQINNKGNVYNSPHLQEFVEAEKHYNNRIDNMWMAVKQTKGPKTSELENDLKSLDEVYNELKQELLSGKGNNTNEVVNSMIGTYRTKIELLESVLNESSQQNNIQDDKVEI